MATHTMKLAVEPFTAIKNGQKTIESRLYDKKRRQIRTGDTIVFCLNDTPSQQIVATVVELHYDAFAAMFAAGNPHDFGKPTAGELLDQIDQFYSLADQAVSGVVGIRFRLR